MRQSRIRPWNEPKSLQHGIHSVLNYVLIETVGERKNGAFVVASTPIVVDLLWAKFLFSPWNNRNQDAIIWSGIGMVVCVSKYWKFERKPVEITSLDWIADESNWPLTFWFTIPYKSVKHYRFCWFLNSWAVGGVEFTIVIDLRTKRRKMGFVVGFCRDAGTGSFRKINK